MESLTLKEFAVMLTRLALVTGRELDQPTIRAYHGDLEELSKERLIWTMNESRKRAFKQAPFPTCPQLLELSKEYRPPPRKAITSGQPCSLAEAIADRESEAHREWIKLSPEGQAAIRGSFGVEEEL